MPVNFFPKRALLTTPQDRTSQHDRRVKVLKQHQGLHSLSALDFTLTASAKLWSSTASTAILMNLLPILIQIKFSVPHFHHCSHSQGKTYQSAEANIPESLHLSLLFHLKSNVQNSFPLLLFQSQAFFPALKHFLLPTPGLLCTHVWDSLQICRIPRSYWTLPSAPVWKNSLKHRFTLTSLKSQFHHLSNWNHFLDANNES